MPSTTSDRADHVSGEALVHALERTGFVVFRRHRVATLLERGFRAVAVPNLRELPPQALSTVRRMTGLSVAEFRAMLAEDTTAAVPLPSAAAVPHPDR